VTAAKAPAPPTLAPSAVPADVSERASQAQLDALGELALPPGCASCPRRIVDETRSAFGYCEGCSSLTRHCPACGEDKPQVGWGPGWAELRPGIPKPTWTCAECKFEAQRGAGTPRFTHTVTLDELGRHLLAAELGKGSGLMVGEANAPLSAIVQQLKAGRDIDVDLRHVALRHREACRGVLSNAANAVSSLARDEAYKLSRAFSEAIYIDDRPKPGRRALSAAEKSALLNGEKPLSTGTRPVAKSTESPMA
jgi:hypothetical protein